MESISNITRRTSSTIFRTDSTTAGSSEQSELDKQGRRNIKGSILLNLVIGSGFCWGSITTYVASYFKYVVGQEDVNLAQNTYALTFFRIFTMIFMLALPKLTAKYEGKSIIFCAAIIIMVGLVGSALLCQTFLSFQIVFGITQGIGQGLLIFLPIKICWEFYPNNKGVISGIMLGSFGFSSFIFNTLSIYIINPMNYSVQSNGFYTNSVAKNIPDYFYMIFAIYLVFLTLGYSMIQEKKKTATEQSIQENGGVDCPSYYQIIFKDSIFFYLFTMNCLSIIYPFFLEAEYKVFGQIFIKDDSFLTTVGTIASLCSSMRFIWSFVLDTGKLDYYQLQAIVFMLQMVLALFTYTAAQTNDLLYMVVVGLSQICYGAPFVMLPVHCIQVASSPEHGLKLYSLVFSFGAFSSYIMTYLDYFFTTYDISILGRPNSDVYKNDGTEDPEVYKSIYVICFFLNVIGMVLLVKYTKMMRKRQVLDDNFIPI